MLLNITKSMMILAMLFLFSCSKDSTSTDTVPEEEVLKKTSVSMTLAGSMSGDETVTIMQTSSSGTGTEKSYMLQGMIGMTDGALIVVSPATSKVSVTLTEAMTQKGYMSSASMNISRNDDKVLEGTFSGEATRFPPGSGTEIITITNGKFYINKTK